MTSPLVVRGPTNCGFLNQFKVVSWRYISSRFGLLGQTIQCSNDIPDDDAIHMATKSGTRIHRRLDGKNGWLWKTIYDHQERLADIEYKQSIDYMLVPRWLKWIRRLIK